MRANWARLAAILVTGGAMVSAARADADAAKKYLADAKSELESHNVDNAKAKIDLAEAELDGVDAAAKAPIVAEIEAVKAQFGSEEAANVKAHYARRLKMAVDEAEGSIGNLVTWGGAVAAVKEIIDRDDVKAAMPDEVAAAKKKMATFTKLNDKKAGAALAEQAEQNVKELETAWAENKPKLTTDDKSSAVREMTNDLESTRRAVKGMSDEAAAPYVARIDKIGAEFAAIALADLAKEQAERLQEHADLYKSDWDGWKAETTGPTLAEMTKAQNEKLTRLNAPKSVTFVSRADDFLKNLENDEDYQKVASAPAVKAIVDGVKADRDAARAKIEGFAAKVIDDADKAKLDENSLTAFRNFQDSLAFNLEASPKLEELAERTKSIVEKNEKGNAAANAASASLNAQLSAENAAAYAAAKEKAAADWPAMKAKFATEDGFDPNNPGAFKGKYITFTTDNLIGYRFSPGDFPFATTIDGTPIAGKFDPAVAKAVKDVEAKLAHNLGDNDDDGKWEVVAMVTGNVGKLVKRENVEGQIRDTAGNTATVTGEKHETVDAPIITVVAAHCGPLAVAK